MADKRLKIILDVDTTSGEQLPKLIETATKSVSKLQEVENQRAKLVKDQQDAYGKLTEQIKQANDLLAKGSQFASMALYRSTKATDDYNNSLRKTQEELRKINTLENAHLALMAGVGAPAIARTGTNNQPNTNAGLSSNIQTQTQVEAQQNLYATMGRMNDAYTARYKAALEARAAADNAYRKTTEAEYNQLFQSLGNKLTAGMTKAGNFAKDASAQLSVGMSAAGLNAAKVAAEEATKANQKLTASVDEAGRAHKNIVLHIAEVLGIYKILNFVVNSVVSAFKAIPTIGIELESTKASLTATAGSAANMTSTMIALHDEAIRTGIAISTLRESYRGFQASTSLAGASAESTWQMFTNLNTVITGLHLSTDKANGIFLAMAQIFNKGKVQSEELVKQLGNLLPGAFASMAASMNISGQELSKRMKAGVVLARDVMEEFTNFYAQRFAPAFNLASQGLNANFGRLKTSFTELGETIYNATSSGMNSFVKGLTDVVNSINEAITGTTALTKVFNTGVNVAIAAAIGYLYQASTGFIAVSTAAKVTATGIVEVTLASRAMEASLAFISAPATLIAGFALVGLEMAKFAKDADGARLAVEKTVEDSKKLAENPVKPGTLEYKVANDPEVKRVTAEYEHLQKVIVETQDKINGKNFQLGDNLALLNREQVKNKAALESLGPVLDNLKDKARITIQVESGEAIRDISQVARQFEILARRAKGDTVGAAKMAFEDTNKASLDQLLQVKKEAEAIAKGSDVNELSKHSAVLKSDWASEEEKAKAQAYLDNYNQAISAIGNYNTALTHAGEDTKKINKEHNAEIRAHYKDISTSILDARGDIEAKLKEIEHTFNRNGGDVTAYFAEKRKLVLEDLQLQRDALNEQLKLAFQEKDKVKVADLNHSVAKIDKTQSVKLQEIANEEFDKKQQLRDTARNEALTELQAKEQRIQVDKIAGFYSEQQAVGALIQAREEYIKKAEQDLAIEEELANSDARRLELAKARKQLELLKREGSGAAQNVLNQNMPNYLGTYNTEKAKLDIGQAAELRTADSGMGGKGMMLDYMGKAGQVNIEQSILDQKLAVNEKYAQANQVLHLNMYAGMTGAAANTFEGITSMMIKMYGAQSKQAKIAFAAYKAAKIAEITMATASLVISMANSGAQWGPAGVFMAPVAAGIAAAMGAVQIAQVIAQPMPAAHGGLDYVPAEQTYLLNKGERVLSPKQNTDLTNYLNQRTMGNNNQTPSAPAQVPQNNVRIINTVDPELFHEWAGSPKGEQVIMNVVKRNQAA